MIGAIFFLNSKGFVILSRIYRNTEIVKGGISSSFRSQMVGVKDLRSPVLYVNNHTFFHIKHEDIFIAAETVHNVDATMVFEILYGIRDIIKIYLGGQLNEQKVIGHMILIYEILDEMLDYGYPQNCQLDAIKPFITQKGKKIKPEKLKGDQLSKITINATGAVPWRTGNEKYKKNEIRMDIVESVNVLVSVDGKVLRADVSGKVVMFCYLSGSPECKFGINDKVLMETESRTRNLKPHKSTTSPIAIDDVTFHQCVRLPNFESDRSISFIPPDGEFELMKYRTTENIQLPFRIFPIVKERSKTRVEIKITVKSTFSRTLVGTHVKVKVPVPKNTAVVKARAQTGRAKYYPEHEAIIWKIRAFPGEADYTLHAEVEISASVRQQKPWSRPPISMEFQVPMLASSGFHVRYLKVIEKKQNYEAIKLVRYLTQAGNYQYRI